MNKTLIGILIGVALGAGGTWLFLEQHKEGEPAKAAAKPEEKKESPLHLPAAKREALGIALAKPTETMLASEVEAFGRVVDPTPFVALVAEQETARASLAASEKELDRVKKLHELGGNASAQAFETAQANAARDRAAIASVRVRLLANWGRKLADDADLEALRGALEKGAALVRLDVLPGETPAAEIKAAQISIPGTEQAFGADVLGAAPVADPQVQGASVLAIVRDHLLPAGTALRAKLPGSQETAKAFTIPRDAIVYHQGSAWVFVLEKDDIFERKLVTLGRAGRDEVAIMSGLEADDQVATKGAQQLLSAELQAGGASEG